MHISAIVKFCTHDLFPNVLITFMVYVMKVPKIKKRTRTVSRLRYGRSGVRFPSRPERVWVPPSLRFNGYWGVLDLEKEQPEHKFDHTSAPSVEVKNRWSYTSASFGCLHGGEGQFYLYLCKNHEYDQTCCVCS